MEDSSFAAIALAVAGTSLSSTGWISGVKVRSLFFYTKLFYLALILSLADYFLLSGEANTFKTTTAATLQYFIIRIG